MYGWNNKKELTYWDTEDTRKLYKCLWIKDFRIQTFSDRQVRERTKYYDDLFEALVQCLPKPELNDLIKKVSDTRNNKTRQRFEIIIRCSLMDMQQKLAAHEHHKIEILQPTSSLSQKEMTFQQYRDMQHSIKYPNDSDEQKQQEESIGYVPSEFALENIPPIEILEHIGFKLTKYDKCDTYYIITIKFPSSLNKKLLILYDTNAQALEAKAESIFESEIDNYLKMNANPYGDKSFISVDISNIEQVMNSNNTNPLDEDIF